MDFKINSILKSYGIGNVSNSSSKVKKSESTSQVSSSALEISNSVKTYNSTLDTVKSTQDVREDVVAKYKGLLNSGEYNVSVSDLADKLLNN